MVKIFDAGAQNKVEIFGVDPIFSSAMRNRSGHWPKFGHTCPPNSEHEYQVPVRMQFDVPIYVPLCY